MKRTITLTDADATELASLLYRMAEEACTDACQCPNQGNPPKEHADACPVRSREVRLNRVFFLVIRLETLLRSK